MTNTETGGGRSSNTPCHICTFSCWPCCFLIIFEGRKILLNGESRGSIFPVNRRHNKRTLVSPHSLLSLHYSLGAFLPCRLELGLCLAEAQFQHMTRKCQTNSAVRNHLWAISTQYKV